MNKYLTERNFMAATTSVYNFWLYELCDVYIVSPLFPVPSSLTGILSLRTILGSDEAHDG